MENTDDQPTKKCSKCGEDILKVAKRCKHCDANFEVANFVKVLIFIVVIIIIVLIGRQYIKGIEDNIDSSLQSTLDTMDKLTR